MIIQSGLILDVWKASSTFSRLAIFLIFVSRGRLEVLLRVSISRFQIERAQQLADAFGAHRGGEVVAELLDLGEVVVFGQELACA